MGSGQYHSAQVLANFSETVARESRNRLAHDGSAGAESLAQLRLGRGQGISGIPVGQDVDDQLLDDLVGQSGAAH
jgi:hypothetical protein